MILKPGKYKLKLKDDGEDYQWLKPTQKRWESLTLSYRGEINGLTSFWVIDDPYKEFTKESPFQVSSKNWRFQSLECKYGII